MGRELPGEVILTWTLDMDVLRTEGSAQEVGMQKLHLKNALWTHSIALWSSLLSVAFVVTSSQAEDYKGFERARTIDWRSSYRKAVDEANRDGKPLVVCVTASWCGPCRQMKQLTFNDSRVIELVQAQFVPYMIDADEHPELVTGFGIEAYPTTLVIAPDLSILKRLPGFQSPSDLVNVMSSVGNSVPSTRTLVVQDEPASALAPANALTFGFDGYCLVSILEESLVQRGSPEFVAEHRGQMICFQTDVHRQKFLANPEKYWPVANGQCLVSSREGTETGKGDPRMAVTWRGRIWLFSDRERQQRFIQMPLYYVNEL